MPVFKKTLFLFSLFFIFACQTIPQKQATTAWDDPLWQRQYTLLQTITVFSSKGRIGISTVDDSFSSNYLWQQQQQGFFTFRMYGAFGQTYAVMNISPELTTLDTGDEQHFEGPDAEYLLFTTLGWSLPINLLQDWVKGLPTGISHNNISINADGTLQELNYLDYKVYFERYAEYNLPKQEQAATETIKLPTKIRILQGNNKIILTSRNWTF